MLRYKTRSLTNDLGTLSSVYRSLVQPYFDYCSLVWGNCSKTRADQLQKLQNRAARIITKADYSVRSCDTLEELKWPTLNDRRAMQMNIMMYKVYRAAVPEYLTELFRLTPEVHNYNLRGQCKFDMQLPKPKTNSLKRSFAYRGATAWNALSNHVRDLKLTLSSFKAFLRRGHRLS